ncbi:hypothetical protein FQN60_002731 [Etheostoma spectabile]|uniref:Uncharacterized protein n=1 Tax=Etheostoma spectabile TaxID=54343 RepID=A0A5J5CLI0_9PERO|nr:hypothetical protein FQN60_002731 [Etheostoma spectabile]
MPRSWCPWTLLPTLASYFAWENQPRAGGGLCPEERHVCGGGGAMAGSHLGL